LSRAARRAGKSFFNRDVVFEAAAIRFRLAGMEIRPAMLEELA